MENQNPTANSSDDRIVISVREFNATIPELFDAWTNAEKLAKWWGPKGFSNTFDEFNPTPGGNWRFTMHGPDGKNYPNESVYVEVGPAKITIDHLNWPIFRLTATFEPVGDKTKLTFKQEFESADVFEKVKAIVVPSNEENFDRLAVVLTEA